MLVGPRFRTLRRASLWFALGAGLLPLPSSAESTAGVSAPIVDATDAAVPALPVAPPADVVMLDATALSDLVAPIALYPDDLLAIVLPASTYPLQIVQAARFLERLESEPGLKPDDAWDPSVVALLNYPEALARLNDDLDWTWRLGTAVINQQSDVVQAVSDFRERAHVAGNLETDERQIVEATDDTITIRPASPDRIYVPYYEPARVVVYQAAPVVYYYPSAYPVYYYPYPADYYFPWPYFWGVTSAFSIGWATHHVHVYHHHHRYHPYSGCHYYAHRYYHHGYDYHDRWRDDRYDGRHRDYDRYRGDHDRFRDGDDRWRYDRDGGDWGAGRHYADGAYSRDDRHQRPLLGHPDRADDRNGRGDDRWRHDDRRGGARPAPSPSRDADTPSRDADTPRFERRERGDILTASLQTGAPQRDRGAVSSARPPAAAPAQSRSRSDAPRRERTHARTAPVRVDAAERDRQTFAGARPARTPPNQNRIAPESFRRAQNRERAPATTAPAPQIDLAPSRDAAAPRFERSERAAISEVRRARAPERDRQAFAPSAPPSRAAFAPSAPAHRAAFAPPRAERAEPNAHARSDVRAARESRPERSAHVPREARAEREPQRQSVTRSQREERGSGRERSGGWGSRNRE
jgi:hypothetical protein